MNISPISVADPPTQKQGYRKYTPRYSNGNPIWQYFTVYPYSRIPTCNACGKMIMNGWKSIAGNTTNMRSHLKNKHPHLFRELCAICESEQKKHYSGNWTIIPYVSRDEFLERIIPKPESEPEYRPPSQYSTPERLKTPLSTCHTPVNTHSPTEPTIPKLRFLKEELEAEEATLRLELLRSQIRREVATAQFYQAQTKAIEQGRFPFIFPQSPPQ
ncbi:hypothetical protein FO519_004964 [Halicephalobus sp. NKZ332]|nr:hypothetical protein FO519_004964 [Halicephalobus sp. NKZ332]